MSTEGLHQEVSRPGRSPETWPIKATPHKGRETPGDNNHHTITQDCTTVDSYNILLDNRIERS